MSAPASGPAVFLHVAPGDPAPRALRELRAGLEEEGVPCRVRAMSASEAGADDDASEPRDAVALAHAAARLSPVSVGIGLDADAAALHLPQLPAAEPLLRLPVENVPERMRALGHNAARLVKGAPLKELP